MTDGRLADQQMTEGFIGTSPAELSKLSDAELADWQSHIPAGLPQHILAEKEWETRIALRHLREQFNLEERLANRNRWWSIAASVIGVIGTLAGVGLGKWLDSSSQVAKSTPQAESPEMTKPSASSTTAKSAVSSTTAQPEKKAK